MYAETYLYPAHNEVVGVGYIGFTPSVRPSVRPVSRVRFVVPTVLVGSFHIYTSYRATSDGVWRVQFLAKFQNLNFWYFFKFVSLTLSCFDLVSDVNH